MWMLATDDQAGTVIGGVALCFFILIFGLIAFAKLREVLFPKKVRNRMRRYFGGEFLMLQGHEKSYPGYDLASVVRALQWVMKQNLKEQVQLGSLKSMSSLSDLLGRGTEGGPIPGAPAFERVPVGVDDDDSVLSNCLYLGRLQSGRLGTLKDRSTPGVAIFLANFRVQHVSRHERMDVRSGAPSSLTVSIACTSKAIANAFFAELEEARKRLSVYRGQVIDPEVDGGVGITSVGFVRIRQVKSDDLVLTAPVRELIEGSIVQFYRNGDALRQLGVEMKRGVLFHSPPGTGKTSVSLYLAGLLPNFTVCFISGRRLLYPRELCAMARYLQPTMLVFEDIDLIAEQRDANGLATVLGELMNQIDGCEPNDQVLFVMNTNSMDRLEAAVRDRPGRVDQIIHLPLPSFDDRVRLIRTFARTARVDEDAVNGLAHAADGVTPAVLKEVVKRAAVMAIARGESASKDSTFATIQLQASDLMLALQQVLSMRTDVRHRDPAARTAIGFSTD